MNNNSKKTVEDILANLKVVFNRTSRQARYRAWDRIQTKQGQEEIRKLLNNPSRSLKLFQNFLTFSEWLEQNGDQTIHRLR